MPRRKVVKSGFGLQKLVGLQCFVLGLVVGVALTLGFLTILVVSDIVAMPKPICEAEMRDRVGVATRFKVPCSKSTVESMWF